MEKITIGVDHGNSEIKTRNCRFPVALVQLGIEPTLGNDYLAYNGNYYTVVRNADTGYLKDKTEDERYFLLTLIAIAKELEVRNKSNTEEYDVELAVGLPPEHHKILKDKYRNYLQRGRVAFKYGGKNYNIYLNKVTVTVQGFAAAITVPHNDVSTYYIVDIGGYTVDVLRFEDNRTDLSVFKSYEMGVIRMISRICDILSARNDDAQKQILDALTGKDTPFDDTQKGVIYSQADASTKEIISKLERDRINFDNPVFFCGGGSLLLRKYIETNPHIKRPIFIPSSNANAQGYEIIARTISNKQ